MDASGRLLSTRDVRIERGDSRVRLIVASRMLSNFPSVSVNRRTQANQEPVAS